MHKNQVFFLLSLAIFLKIDILSKVRILFCFVIMKRWILFPAVVATMMIPTSFSSTKNAPTRNSTKKALTEVMHNTTSSSSQEQIQAQQNEQAQPTIEEYEYYCRERLDESDRATSEEFDFFRPFFSPDEKENIKNKIPLSEQEKREFIKAVYTYLKTEQTLPLWIWEYFKKYAIASGLTGEYQLFLESIKDELPKKSTLYILPPEMEKLPKRKLQLSPVPSVSLPDSLFLSH
jgi:hypothetical protein